MKIAISSLIWVISSLLPLSAEPTELPAGYLETIPQHLLQRCAKERRLAAITKHGGLPATEQAVTDALRFLKNTQNKDGSWTNLKVSGTSIALLCFLGNGETVGSEEFGETILNGVTHLIDTAVKQRGNLTDDIKDHRWPYEHALAVYALAEAYSLCEIGFKEKIPNLRRAVEVSGQIIINKQHKGGGWDYGYSQDNGRGGTVSITGWHLLALKTCKMTGLDFADIKKCYKKGIDYLERMQAASGALGYSSSGSGTPTRASIGALCFQIWEGSENKSARKAVKFISKEMKFGWDTPDCDLYGQFFAAPAMLSHGGKVWKDYHEMVFPEILKSQAPDGSFLIVNHGNHGTILASNPIYGIDEDYGKHFRACFATLILQSYYR